MTKLEIPYFKKNKELLKFLVENKEQLIFQKKAIIKQADGFAFIAMPNLKDYGVSKAIDVINDNIKEIQVKAIINTTNLMDSHKDVHIPNIWKKSLKENKSIMHIQEHEIGKFSSIISSGNDLKAYTKNYTWKELGFDFKGETEALEFDSTVSLDRNKFMFNQYKNGFVTNHSVGMRYVKLKLAIADKNIASADEFETWEEFFPMIANKEEAEHSQHFWAVTQAKVIEGSAVPLGSNFVTPTISVEAAAKHLKNEAAAKHLEDKKNYLFN